MVRAFSRYLQKILDFFTRVLPSYHTFPFPLFHLFVCCKMGRRNSTVFIHALFFSLSLFSINIPSAAKITIEQKGTSASTNFKFSFLLFESKFGFFVVAAVLGLPHLLGKSICLIYSYSWSLFFSSLSSLLLLSLLGFFLCAETDRSN